MFKKLHASTIGVLMNNRSKGGWETLCFLGHRLSGLALTFYLVAHICVVSPLWGNFDTRMGLLHHPVAFVLELLLFAAVVAHMLNGVRLMLGDFFGLTKQQKYIFNAIVFAGAIIFLLGATIMIVNFNNLISGH